MLLKHGSPGRDTRNTGTIFKFADGSRFFLADVDVAALRQSTGQSAIPEGMVPTHRHRKRGSEYVLLGFGKMQSERWAEIDPNWVDGPKPSVDMREVAIYRSVDNGLLWVRPREEFEDGRFEAIAPTPDQHTAPVEGGE